MQFDRTRTVTQEKKRDFVHPNLWAGWVLVLRILRPFPLSRTIPPFPWENEIAELYCVSDSPLWNGNFLFWRLWHESAERRHNVSIPLPVASRPLRDVNVLRQRWKTLKFVSGVKRGIFKWWPILVYSPIRKIALWVELSVTWLRIFAFLGGWIFVLNSVRTVPVRMGIEKNCFELNCEDPGNDLLQWC